MVKPYLHYAVWASIWASHAVVVLLLLGAAAERTSSVPLHHLVGESLGRPFGELIQNGVPVIDDSLLLHGRSGRAVVSRRPLGLLALPGWFEGVIGDVRLRPRQLQAHLTPGRPFTLVARVSDALVCGLAILADEVRRIDLVPGWLHICG